MKVNGLWNSPVDRDRCWCLVAVVVAEDSASFSFGLFEPLLCICVDSVSIPY